MNQSWLLALLFFSLPSWSAQSCNAGCNGGDVQINLVARCMCYAPGKCIRISIGRAGPMMTSSGSGVTKPAHGAKFKTHTSGNGKITRGGTDYDNDAIAMGIPANDSVGKWIHKTPRCAPGGGAVTKGCVAVPCDVWPDVKEALLDENGKGKRLVVCGGAAPGSRHHKEMVDEPVLHQKSGSPSDKNSGGRAR